MSSFCQSTLMNEGPIVTRKTLEESSEDENINLERLRKAARAAYASSSMGGFSAPSRDSNRRRRLNRSETNEGSYLRKQINLWSFSIWFSYSINMTLYKTNYYSIFGFLNKNNKPFFSSFNFFWHLCT